MITRPIYSLVIVKKFLTVSQINFSGLVTVILYTNNFTWPPQMPSTVKTLILLTTGANSRYLLPSYQVQYYSLNTCSAIKQTASQAVYRTIRPISNSLNPKSISTMATQNARQAQTKLYINWLNLFTYIIPLTAKKATGWLQYSIFLKKLAASSDCFWSLTIRLI